MTNSRRQRARAEGHFVLPRIGISLGDPSGIGFEVTRAALSRRDVRRALTPVLFGDASMQVKVKGVEFVECSELRATDRRPGRPSKAGGAAQLEYVQAAMRAAKRGEIDGLCTAPVSKEAITSSGRRFTGHTELLAAFFECDVMMLMKGPRLSVALATNHLPLSQVPRALTKVKLTAQLRFLSKHLGRLLGRVPRIAVCGLNPHAGDGGVLGTEETRIITPAVVAARKLGVKVDGPFAADGLFASGHAFPFDVALAMFHDQGLVATKAVDFANTVNVTLGLPMPRTSPDHGVAYDIAGKGLADETPMVAALLEAAAQVRAGS